MYGFGKRLERLKSSGGLMPEQPAGAPPANTDGAPTTPDLKRSSRKVQQVAAMEEEESAGEGGFSVLLMGISKESANPRLIRHAVDECLRSNFSFAPRVTGSFVTRVEFCRHPLHDGAHFAVVVFASRVMAELFVEVHASKGIDFPFAADGKRVLLELNHKSPDFARLDLLGDNAIVYISGLPRDWANADRLRDRFEEILEDARPDFGLNLVKLVQVLPGAAMLGFKSKVVVDLLMYKCKINRSWLAPIGEQLVMVSAKGDHFHQLLGEINPPVEPSSPPRLPPGFGAAAPKKEPPSPTRAPAAPKKEPPSPSGAPAAPNPVAMEVDPSASSRRRVVAAPQAGLEQRSLFLSYCNLEKFNQQRVVEMVTRVLEKASPGSGSREFQLIVDINTGWPQLIFSSGAAAESVMSYYVSHTEKLQVEDFPFAITRHKLYSRPRAVYRHARTFSKSMTLMLSGLKGLRVHQLLLRGAVSEMLERILAETGALAAGGEIIRSLTFTPGLDCAVISIEETIAVKLLSITNNITLSGRRLSVIAPGSDQSTLNMHNLPTTQAKYSPTALRSIVLYVLKKHHPELATPGCISDLSWPVGSPRASVVFQSEAVSDAFMDSYIAHTDDFCKQELVFTIYRHASYIRPGTVYNREICPSPVVRSLLVLGIQESLHPIPLRGALIELLDRALAGTGLLKQGQSLFRHFYYLKGNTSAQLMVDELVANELVDRPGLMLAGGALRIVHNPLPHAQAQAIAIAPPAPIAPAPISVAAPAGELVTPAAPAGASFYPSWAQFSDQSGEPAAPGTTGTGGWIELEEGELS